jgi:V/A-type H+-transporting ATPase subunit C
MMASSNPGSYYYVCTRMRVRRTQLIPREMYLRLLQMSLPEITLFIEGTQYKQEIDELATSFSGIDLVEVALSWNLGKEYQKILDISPGALKSLTAGYLRKWDIQNVLTLLRGKVQGVKPGRIKEVLIPAGELDRTVLDRLLTEETPERVVDALKRYRISAVLVRELPRAMETGSLDRMENELYKQFYEEILREAAAGVKGGEHFTEYIRLEIDIKNVINLFRLMAQAPVGDVGEILIPGGGIYRIPDLLMMAGIRDRNELIDKLMERTTLAPLLELLEDLKKGRSIREIEILLTRFQLAQMERLSKRYPFSIYPVLSYLESKRIEVYNLRAIARGKERNLSPELIRDYLVM